MSTLSDHNKEISRIKQYNLQSNLYNGRDPDRYYLEEYFHQRPVQNSDLTNTTEATRVVANRNFELVGTSASCTFDSNRAGIKITTDTSDQRQAIILPHLDTNQTAWTGIKWGTENQVQWECSITTGSSIADVKIWAGLKETNDQLISADNNQAYFKFQTDADNSEAFTDFTKLHFVHSIVGVHYISDLGITVAADTNYHLKIIIDSDRKVSAFVNGDQYSLTSIVGGTGGTTTGKGSTQSKVLTNDIDLIPYVGVEAGTGSAKHIIVHYEKMSRVLFE